MKKLTASRVFAAAAMIAVAAPALADVAANIGVNSNYMWRGVTQSDDSAAVSGGIDYEDASGLYTGVWVSTIDFTPAGGEKGTETDLYFGFSGEAKSLAYDVGYIYYLYSEEEADVDFGEIYANFTFSMLSAGIAYTTNNGSDNDGVAFEQGDLFYHVGVSAPLNDDWSAGATYGYYDFTSDGDVGALESYGYFQLDVSKAAGDFGDFTLSLIKAEEESGDDDTKLVVGWAKSF